MLHVFSTGICRNLPSKKAFLFSLYNINGYAPVKVNIKPSRYSYAIRACDSRGPFFGNGPDLYINENPPVNGYSGTNCGASYYLPPGYSLPRPSATSFCRFYAGSNGFIPTDVEVFYETTTWGVCAKSYLLTQPTFMDPVSFARLAKWKWSTWSLYLKF